jgi:hypothetical protein
MIGSEKENKCPEVRLGLARPTSLWHELETTRPGKIPFLPFATPFDMFWRWHPLGAAYSALGSSLCAKRYYLGDTLGDQNLSNLEICFRFWSITFHFDARGGATQNAAFIYRSQASAP